MEKEGYKGKIKYAKTLGGKYIHRKTKEEDYIKKEVKNTEDKTIQKTKKDTFFVKENHEVSVGQFQLVVVKIPWYKKAFRKLIGFLGLSYEW